MKYYVAMKKEAGRYLNVMQQTASTVRGRHNKAQKMCDNMFLFNTHPRGTTSWRSTLKQEAGLILERGEGQLRRKWEREKLFMLWLLYL